jgi:hypothetical protein
MTNEEYHSLPSISKSGLDLINRSPAHYQWAKHNPTTRTPAMRIGSLTHMAVLEPDLFQAECVIMPEMDRRTKAGKIAWEDFQAVNSGRDAITTAEHQRILAIRDAVHAHPLAKKLIDRIAAVEVSTFWQDPATGVDCRCRPDAVLANGMLIDLKTTQDAGSGFMWSVKKYRYNVQAAFYADGMGRTAENQRAMIFIAVETNPPYFVCCHIIGTDTLEAGRDDYRRNLDTYAECLESGIWPGYPETLQTINLPNWATQED